MKNIQKYILPGLLLLVGLAAVFWFSNREEQVEAKSTAVSSSVSLDFAAAQDDTDDVENQQLSGALLMYYGKMQAQLKNIADDSSGEIGITYLDLATGQNVSINGNQLFYGASTTKVPLVMLISDKVAAGELSWNQQVKYDKKYYEEGTGTLQGNLKASYKLSDLATLSITVSDNIAKNMLYSLLGGNEAGIKQIYSTYLGKESQTGKNEISSSDAAAILEQLYNQSSENKDYQTLLNNMQRTVFHKRLETRGTAGHLAHKIGTYEDEVHDTGIFYNAHPYVLTVYTNKLKNAENVIAQISDEVWDLQSNAYPE